MSFLYKGFEIKKSGVGEDKCRACIKSGGICDFKKLENTVIYILKRSIPKDQLSIISDMNIVLQYSCRISYLNIFWYEPL